jgi:hypothetical protein
MAILLFRLNQVPDDEAMDIRELLAANEIYFYETHAGFWRMGVDAIWLPDASAETQARELIAQYQHERTERQQQNHAQLVAQGEQVTLWKNLRAQPFRMLAAVLAVLFVLGLTLAPVALMMKP